MKPLVSICMPHLNSRPFTEERMETILKQSLENWELIIVDSRSDDGSLQVLQDYARRDSRVRLEQAPRDGIYRNLNRALDLCRGHYVYIATSDDTMTPDCLEQMARALDRNSGCGVCHCCLQIIDEKGRAVDSEHSWEKYAVQEYFGAWNDKSHVRRSPHDGLLHLGFFTVYTSLTQLLVRRRVYQELGRFRTDCSSYADFEWGMRVGLNENIVHLPLKLATWRWHDRQATNPDRLLRSRARGEFHRLACEALKSLKLGNPRLAAALKSSALHYFYLVDEMKVRRLLGNSAFGRLSAVAGFAVSHPIFLLHWLTCKIAHGQRVTGDFEDAVRREFTNLGLGELLCAAA